jgi:hypothetical protein
MVAIFKALIATIHNELAAREASGAPLPWFEPSEVQYGDDTVSALNKVMSIEEVRGCTHNLFVGPEEVQSVAFLSLVAMLIAPAPNGGEVLGSTTDLESD